jgi:hypothetical protein
VCSVALFLCRHYLGSKARVDSSCQWLCCMLGLSSCFGPTKQFGMRQLTAVHDGCHVWLPAELAWPL